MEKRYVATIEFYVWADSDKEAIAQVKNVCDEMDAKEDNRCELVSLYEQPYGTLTNRKVYGQ